MKTHSGCCGCALHGASERDAGMARRTFLAAVGGSALAGCATTAGTAALGSGKGRAEPVLEKKTLVVQPALVYNVYGRREKTSWRPWGGLHTEGDIDQEVNRIGDELAKLAKDAEFDVAFLPVARVRSMADAEAAANTSADVMLIYAANGGLGEIERLISPDRYNLLYVRHTSGPVYLWYEIAHNRLLRKTVDEYGQPGLEVYDVIVDDYAEMLWRLRALFALKNTVGSKMVAIGGPSGWGAGGAVAPQIAVEKWKMDIQTVSYDDLGQRIVAARQDAERVRQSQADAAAYLKDSKLACHVDTGHIERSFLLAGIFNDLMAEAGSQAITINHCMGAIMPLAETTACLTLSIINDAGTLAFCESDFAVIPSGVLLHHICHTPVFLQDPTYPHDGIVTLAHCTAPRKMDGKRLEKAQIVTHFESDFGAAPKVDMKIGQEVTVLNPDFADKRWIGFRGTIAGNPFLDICRSQVEVAIDGDWRRLMEDMRGFHWMLAYGNHLKETGYALRKLGIDWYNLTNDRTVET